MYERGSCPVLVFPGMFIRGERGAAAVATWVVDAPSSALAARVVCKRATVGTGTKLRYYNSGRREFEEGEISVRWFTRGAFRAP